MAIVIFIIYSIHKSIVNLETGLTNLKGKIAPILHEYAAKLNYKQEQLEEFDGILESMVDILKTSKPMEWDKIGAKLENGSVVLPSGFESKVNEIVKENQLYSLFIPEKFGGAGYSTIFMPSIAEMISYTDLSLSSATLISLAVMEPLFNDSKNEYFRNVINGFLEGKRTGYVAFTEPQAGSNLENVSATSEKQGDGYILNGTKIFISNGGYANTGLFLAKNEKQRGHNVFLLDKLDDIKVERLEDKLGLHSDPTAQLRVENLYVDKDHLVGKEGEGYKSVLARLMSMRLGVSLQATGSAQRAYDLANYYAENRTQFNRPINKFEAVKRKLDEMSAQLPRMREISYRSALALDRYQHDGIPHDLEAGGIAEKVAARAMPEKIKWGLANYYVSTAKIYCSEIVNDIADDALQIHGGNGFMSEVEANKIYRDVRVLPIYEGTSEVHEWIIDKAKQALSFAPKIKPFLSKYEDRTLYEKMLLLKFPSLENIL